MTRHTRNRRTQRKGKGRRRQTRGKRTQRGGFLGLFEDTSFDIQKKINSLNEDLKNPNLGPQEIDDIKTKINELGIKMTEALNKEKNPEQKKGWFDSLFDSSPSAQVASPVAGTIPPGYPGSPQVASPVAGPGYTSRGGRRRRRSNRRK